MRSSCLIIAIATGVIFSCKSSKEVKTTSATATATTTAAAPTTEDLAKVAQTKWPNVTAQTISEGKELYNNGACVNCHGAKKITSRSEEQWPSIIDRMAPKAGITEAQKDAVLKYVLAVKMASK